MASTGARRVARGSAAAAVSTFVALLSHVAGGGTVPAVLGVLAPLILSVAVCTVLAGRRLPLARIAASVVASQALFHSLFVLGSPGGVSAAAGPTADATHLHSVVLTSAASHSHATGTGMWVAHAVAAVLTIVALRRGELAGVRLLALGRLALEQVGLRRLRRALTVRALPLRRPASDVTRSHPAVMTVDPGRSTALFRRGPPVALAAA